MTPGLVAPGLPTPDDGPRPDRYGTPGPLDGLDEPTVHLPRRRGAGRRTVAVRIVLALLLGGLGVAGWSLGRSAASSASVGDCLAGAGQALHRIDCADPVARFRVADRRENRTAADAGGLACRDVASATESYWESEQGDTGLVLCLAPVGHS